MNTKYSKKYAMVKEHASHIGKIILPVKLALNAVQKLCSFASFVKLFVSIFLFVFLTIKKVGDTPDIYNFLRNTRSINFL